MVAWQAAFGILTVQSDSDWAGDKSTRKSVSAGNMRYGQHLLRSWSKDETVVTMGSGEAALYAAYMTTQHAMGTESMARELEVHLGAPWNCKWTSMRPMESSAGKDWDN